MVIILFGALQSLAIGQSTNVDLSVSAQKTQIKPAYPAVEYKLETKQSRTTITKTDKIVRYGNMSSQAWSTIAARQQNRTDVHDVKTYESQLCLCSLGF